MASSLSFCNTQEPSPSLSTLRFEYLIHVSKHKLIFLLKLIQLKRLNAKLAIELSELLIPVGIILAMQMGYLACGRNSLPFLYKTGNSGKEGDSSFLASLCEILNVICALYRMSIQKIPREEKKGSRIHVLISIQPLQTRHLKSPWLLKAKPF